VKLCMDTNAYSAFKKGDQHVTELLEQADEIVISTVVLGELYAGFMLGSLERKNMRELREFLDRPGVCVTPISDEIALRYASIVRTLRSSGMPIPTNDIWIAATALENGARLLSLDGHFSKIPTLIVEA
jgi:tRNA(fMet)-specific endonuclease VapC